MNVVSGPISQALPVPSHYSSQTPSTSTSRLIRVSRNNTRPERQRSLQAPQTIDQSSRDSIGAAPLPPYYTPRLRLSNLGSRIPTYTPGQSATAHFEAVRRALESAEASERPTSTSSNSNYLAYQDDLSDLDVPSANSKSARENSTSDYRSTFPPRRTTLSAREVIDRANNLLMSNRSRSPSPTGQIDPDRSYSSVPAPGASTPPKRSSSPITALPAGFSRLVGRSRNPSKSLPRTLRESRPGSPRPVEAGPRRTTAPPSSSTLPSDIIPPSEMDLDGTQDVSEDEEFISDNDDILDNLSPEDRATMAVQEEVARREFYNEIPMSDKQKDGMFLNVLKKKRELTEDERLHLMDALLDDDMEPKWGETLNPQNPTDGDLVDDFEGALTSNDDEQPAVSTPLPSMAKLKSNPRSSRSFDLSTIANTINLDLDFFDNAQAGPAESQSRAARATAPPSAPEPTARSPPTPPLLPLTSDSTKWGIRPAQAPAQSPSSPLGTPPFPKTKPSIYKGLNGGSVFPRLGELAALGLNVGNSPTGVPPRVRFMPPVQSDAATDGGSSRQGWTSASDAGETGSEIGDYGSDVLVGVLPPAVPRSRTSQPRLPFASTSAPSSAAPSLSVQSKGKRRADPSSSDRVHGSSKLSRARNRSAPRTGTASRWKDYFGEDEPVDVEDSAPAPDYLEDFIEDIAVGSREAKETTEDDEAEDAAAAIGAQEADDTGEEGEDDGTIEELRRLLDAEVPDAPVNESESTSRLDIDDDDEEDGVAYNDGNALYIRHRASNEVAEWIPDVESVIEERRKEATKEYELAKEKNVRRKMLKQEGIVSDAELEHPKDEEPEPIDEDSDIDGEPLYEEGEPIMAEPEPSTTEEEAQEAQDAAMGEQSNKAASQGSEDDIEPARRRIIELPRRQTRNLDPNLLISKAHTPVPAVPISAEQATQDRADAARALLSFFERPAGESVSSSVINDGSTFSARKSALSAQDTVRPASEVDRASTSRGRPASGDAILPIPAVDKSMNGLHLPIKPKVVRETMPKPSEAVPVEDVNDGTSKQVPSVVPVPNTMNSVPSSVAFRYSAAPGPSTPPRPLPLRVDLSTQQTPSDIPSLPGTPSSVQESDDELSTAGNKKFKVRSWHELISKRKSDMVRLNSEGPAQHSSSGFDSGSDMPRKILDKGKGRADGVRLDKGKKREDQPKLPALPNGETERGAESDGDVTPTEQVKRMKSVRFEDKGEHAPIVGAPGKGKNRVHEDVQAVATSVDSLAHPPSEAPKATDVTPKKEERQLREDKSDIIPAPLTDAPVRPATPVKLAGEDASAYPRPAQAQASGSNLRINRTFMRRPTPAPEPDTGTVRDRITPDGESAIRNRIAEAEAAYKRTIEHLEREVDAAHLKTTDALRRRDEAKRNADLEKYRAIRSAILWLLMGLSMGLLLSLFFGPLLSWVLHNPAGTLVSSPSSAVSIPYDPIMASRLLQALNKPSYKDTLGFMALRAKGISWTIGGTLGYVRDCVNYFVEGPWEVGVEAWPPI